MLGVALHANGAAQLRTRVGAVLGRRDVVLELLDAGAECEFVVRIQRADGQAGTKDDRMRSATTFSLLEKMLESQAIPLTSEAW